MSVSTDLPSAFNILAFLTTALSIVAGGPTDPATAQDRVLRHAVFFKYKAGTSQEDRDKVVRAFEALPSKIDSIIGFEWGKRTSADRISGGFDHCFLLSFADEAGRAKYLPHPEHKAFGGVLRPHLDKVFVIDYWAQAPKKVSGKLLRHMVFFKFKPDADKAAIQNVVRTFANLPKKIDVIQDLEWGTNNSPESHDEGFTHAFMVTFTSQEALNTYSKHPAHLALVKLLGPVLQEVRVLDYWTEAQ